MLKLQPHKPLTEVLDRVITAYKVPGKTMGKPNPAPKLSEDDLKEIIKSKHDREIALTDDDVYAFFMPYGGQERAVFDAAAKMFPKSKLISVSGRFHYPPQGFMGWHTNSNAEGVRLYATYATEDDKSYFRYYDLDKKQMVTEWEKKGWNFRAFQVRREKLYWHCVYTDVDRYSFGFRYELA
jgi:hypothetical protein